MAAAIQTNFRVRQSFGKIDRIIDIPNLIDIQMRSYEKFLQANTPANERLSWPAETAHGWLHALCEGPSPRCR